MIDVTEVMRFGFFSQQIVQTPGLVLRSGRNTVLNIWIGTVYYTVLPLQFTVMVKVRPSTVVDPQLHPNRMTRLQLKIRHSNPHGLNIRSTTYYTNLLNTPITMLVLFETPAGYSLFKVRFRCS